MVAFGCEHFIIHTKWIFYYCRNLDISFNRLAEIKNLEKLVNLTKLYLCANKISKIQRLNTLTNITMLELGDNKIRVVYLSFIHTSIVCDLYCIDLLLILNCRQLKISMRSQT